MRKQSSDFGVFAYRPGLSVVPVIHGSGSYAVALRQWLLSHPMDRLVVPLPPSFAVPVTEAVERLPQLTAAVQLGTDDPLRATYVPIEPCQGIIAAIRFALGEHIPILWADRESESFPVDEWVLPDAFAVERAGLEAFCCALLPAISPPESEFRRARIRHMALKISEVYQRQSAAEQFLVVLCDLSDWPWLRIALDQGLDEGRSSDGGLGDVGQAEGGPAPADVVNYGVDPRTQLFFLSELPFLTGRYEQARSDMEDDQDLTIHGLKELFLAARSSYQLDLGNRARKITPLMISQCLKYIRNQTLLDRRMSPSFYTIVKSAQQMMGDAFAVHLVSSAKDYPWEDPSGLPNLKMGIGRAEFPDHGLPDHGLVEMTSRLPGSPREWKSLELNRPAPTQDQRKWSSRWNPYLQCSWPEEDTRIESFRNRVMERARAAIGADLARSEKFSTSLMDGLDLRETLRHWYDGSLYVKILPPSIGQLDATVMVFDNAPDPRQYAWRATWFAEHHNESTLAFFATPFGREVIGPGVAVSTYGGAMFLYPPKSIEDIWTDPRLDYADTLEQRLVAAACMYAESKHVALLSHASPGLALKKIAKRYGRKLVHIPLSHFADSIVQQLRMFHVLNGKHVRSYAAHFIRKV